MSAFERTPEPEASDPPWMEPTIQGEEHHVGRLMKSAFPPAGASDDLKHRLIQQSLNILGEAKSKDGKAYPAGIVAAGRMSAPNDLESTEIKDLKRGGKPPQTPIPIEPILNNRER